MPEINPHASQHSATPPSTQNPTGGVGVKWSAPEFDYYPKGNSWYYSSIAVTLLLLAFAVWQKNFLFAFFIVVAEILMLFWAGKKPTAVEFKLDEKGLTIAGTKFYSYADLKNFGVSEADTQDGEFTEIVVFLKPRLRPSLTILLPKAKSAEIEAALAKKMPKIELEPGMLDALEKFLRF